VLFDVSDEIIGTVPTGDFTMPTGWSGRSGRAGGRSIYLFFDIDAI
jgi:hypothetical protein